MQKATMYLFQEVGILEMGFPNHEFIQLRTGRVPVSKIISHQILNIHITLVRYILHFYCGS